jgi:hypothetical protein
MIAMEGFISSGVWKNTAEGRKRVHWEDGWKRDQAVAREEKIRRGQGLEMDVSNKLQLEDR